MTQKGKLMQDIKVHLSVEHIQYPLGDMSWSCILWDVRWSVWGIKVQILVPTHRHKPTEDAVSDEGDLGLQIRVNNTASCGFFLTAGLQPFSLLHCAAETQISRKCAHWEASLLHWARALAEILKPSEAAVSFFALHTKSTVLNHALVPSQADCNWLHYGVDEGNSC